MEGLQLTDLDIYEIQKRLGELGEAFGSSSLKIVGARAINRTLITLRKHIDQELRATYYVKSGDIKAAVFMDKARPGKVMRGKLVFTNRMSFPLISFGAKQNKSFVSVRVLKANRQRRIAPGGKPNILETEKKKRAAVWIAKGQVFARVEGEERPVMLWGPSFMSFFNKPSVLEQLQQMNEDVLQHNLQREANAMLQGYAKVNYRRR